MAQRNRQLYERRGWRWALYRVVVGPRFPLVRLVIWCVQIPLIITSPDLASAVMYVTILSVAAGIESALTDWVEALKFVTEEDDGPTEQPRLV